MKNGMIFALAGVSTLALATALSAQDLATGAAPGTVVLSPITLIANGQENVEATGGVSVSAEDIEAMQPADVSELFARDSAISVSGGAGPSKRIHVFGLEQSALAVTVDGVPQGPTSWHHTGSNVVDPAFLKAVTVEAGAAAADTGFGAAAGAVRYETVGAKDLLTDGRTQGGRVGLSYGTNGRGLSASLAGYGVYGGFDWFAMVHGTDGKNYENGDGYEIAGTEPGARGALVKLGYEAEGHRIELAVDHTEDDGDRTTKMNMDLNADKLVYPLTVTRNSVSLKYSSTAPTDAWDPEAMLYVTENKYDRPDYVPGDINGDMKLKNRTIGGKIQNTYTMGPGNITSGIDWAYNDYDVDNYGDTDRRYWTMETMQIGAFVQGRFEFENGIDLSTGARVDHHRFTDWNGDRVSDTGASVNGALSYEFAEGYEVFAGASHTWLGYRFGEYALLHARSSDLYTASDFEPSTARNIKLGLNANQDNWTGNLTFFDTRLKNMGEFIFPDEGSPYLGNVDEYRSKGFTLQGTYSWGSGRVGGSFTKADVTQGGEDVIAAGGVAVPVGKTATLFVDQEFAQYNLKVGGSVEWADKLKGDYVNGEGGFYDQSSYTVVNVYGEWRPQNYENIVVHLGIDNLFDRNYYERSSYGERDVFRNGALARDINPLYAPGRTVTLGVKMDF
ncbi:TonB-dependent receptor domain-containing protein [Paracoccus laeviglucosivorans]|uniref:Hemoglobin/transferrin/lactoferrin receptor protein n=1 Tax=Paracoccus laeviglucosivorans TaxID=1197861 RepID=A0A521EHC9_9RHOB|nr:TonB-dependent receptor [Paracoccus laeviglucosivorans]SMO83334.1 hemoglobin/transferrin/lactoferrin receptor protein [Paracoccus laeviglucosivorans]